MDIDSLRRALEALKKATSSKKNIELQASVGQLSSCIPFFQTKTCSQEDFERFKDIFRALISPYKHCTVEAIQFSAAFIHVLHSKIRDAKGTDVLEWQEVLRSLFLGILDLLDEDGITNNHKDVIAKGMYSVLCSTYFAPDASDKDYRLRESVYALLAETSKSNPVNQRKLRMNQMLGGQRLGHTISKARDFLVIEGLLTLFATLLPPARSDKRIEFIESVFNSEDFPGYADFRKIIVSTISKDWDTVEPKILDLLAKSNIAFPQPFKTSLIFVPSGPAVAIDCLYVDNKGLTGNVTLEDENSFDHFSVPYDTVKDVRIVLENARTNVTLSLSVPSELPNGVKIDQMKFTVATADSNRLLQSLRARGVKFGSKALSVGHRKLSKSDSPLTLDFDGNGKSYLEKVKEIGFSASDYLEPESTSDPMIMSANPLDALVTSVFEVVHPKKPIENVECSPPPLKLLKGKAKRIIILSDGEDMDEIKELSSPIRKKRMIPISTKKSKKHTPIVSKKLPQKRKNITDVESDSNADMGEPPSKRLRSRNPPVKKLTPPPISSPKRVKKYGKRSGRSSSPFRVHDHDDHFDDIPSATKPMRKVKESSKPVSKTSAHVNYVERKREKSPVEENYEPAENSVDSKKVAQRVTSRLSTIIEQEEVPSPMHKTREETAAAKGKTEPTITKKPEEPKPKTKNRKNVEGLVRDPSTANIKSKSNQALRKSNRLPWLNREIEISPSPASHAVLSNDIGCDLNLSENLLPDYIDISETLKKDSSGGIIIDTHRDITMVDLIRSDSPVLNLSEVDSAPAEALQNGTDGKTVTNPFTSGRAAHKNSNNDQIPRDSFTFKASSDIPARRDKVQLDTAKDVDTIPNVDHMAQTYRFGIATKTPSRTLKPTLPDQKPLAPAIARSVPQILTAHQPKPTTEISAEDIPVSIVATMNETRIASSELEGLLPQARLQRSNRQHQSHSKEDEDRARRVPLDSMEELEPRKIPDVYMDSPFLQRQAFNLNDKSNSFRSKLTPRNRQMNTCDEKDSDSEHSVEERYEKHPQDVTSRIVNILNEIQVLVVRKISKKVHRVKSEVRIGRDNILRAASNDVMSVRQYSVADVNRLVDLEKEYAAFHKKLNIEFEETVKINGEIYHKLGHVVRHHDRSNLVEMFPKSFPPLPPTMTKKIKL